MTLGALRILKPGLLTTVQDLGRWGHQVDGVPVAGPMDAFSHRLANQLVGNDPDAATLEVTLIGPELVVDADTTIAVCGADFDVAVRRPAGADRRVVPVRAGSVSGSAASSRARAPIWRSPAAC